MLKFEWDPDKNQTNQKLHGISFEEAISVFYDPRYIEYRDLDNSEDEDRFIAIGCIRGRIMIVFVVYTERDNAIRIISAREANSKEEELYYAG
jgi:uncharacterized DUF497 family protein